MLNTLWILVLCGGAFHFSQSQETTSFPYTDDWTEATDGYFSNLTSSEYNFTDEIEVIEEEINVDDIDFGYGRECALKIVFDYRHLFEEITNELLQCKCFGLCPDISDEERTEILRDLKARIALRDSDDDIPIFVTYISVMVVGITGNILVLITVIWIFKTASVTNMFICSLAVADLIVVTICIPFRILDYVGDEIWRLGVEACKFFVYIYFASFMLSVFTLTAMSLERYIVICQPMRAASRSTPGRARRVILLTWVAALVLAVPGAVTSGIDDFECATTETSKKDLRGPLYMYLTVAIFAVPTILMGFSYVRIGMTLWKSLKTVNRMKGGGESDKHKEKSSEIRARIQVIRMLVLVWVLFIITWGPDLIFNCIVSYWGDLDLHMTGDQATIMVQTFNLLTMANSAMNPVLYAFMSRQFRQGFMKVFFCLSFVRRRYQPEKSSTATASTTVRSSKSTSIKHSNGGSKSVNPSTT